jgi:uncharacterized repeat protein (TIGR01451 family)
MHFDATFPRHWPNSPRHHVLGRAAPAATPSFEANLRGGLAIAGNSLLTCPGNVSARRRGLRPGTRAGEPCLDVNNNEQDMRYINVDPGGGRFNSSTAQVSIPSDARVLRAFLYWGADLARGVNNGSEAGAPAGETPTGNPVWRRSLLKVGTEPYVAVDATDPGRDGQWAGVVSWYSQPGNRPGYAYQVRADVTTEIRNGMQLATRRGRAGARLTNVTVANVQAGRGYNRHGGWTLFVAWESPTAAWRNVTLFDGFDFVQVQGGQSLVVGPLDFTGFKTPASGRVDAHATTWTYEGDRSIAGDYIALGRLGAGCAQLPHRSDAANPVDNFFNGSNSRAGVSVFTRVPAFVNQLGFDLDRLSLQEGAIPNDATGASACLGTVGDTYFFGGIAFDVLIRAPNLHIAKVADRTEANPGDVVTYTTTATNPERGPDDPLYPTPTVPATNLVVTDPLPSGLDFVGFVTNPGGVCEYTAATRAIRCAVGTLGVDASFTYSFQARVNAAAQGPSSATLFNAACYRSNTEDEPDTNYFGCDEALVVVPPAPPLVDLGVVKTVSDDVVNPGATLTWHVTATNHGPGISTGFVLADQLPAAVTFVSFTASASLTCTTPAVGATGAVTCTAPSVPAAPAAGSTVTLTITGMVSSTAADGSLLLNVTTVNGDQNEPVPDPHPNRDETVTRVVVPPGPIPPEPPPDPDPDGPPAPPVPPPGPPFVPPGLAGTKLTLAKHATPARVGQGATVVYRLRVVNSGEAEARRVRVCDPFPAKLVVVSARGFHRRGSSLCTTIPRLPVGGRVTLRLDARISPTASAGMVVNRATARAANTRIARARAVVAVRGAKSFCGLAAPQFVFC